MRFLPHVVVERVRRLPVAARENALRELAVPDQVPVAEGVELAA